VEGKVLSRPKRVIPLPTDDELWLDRSVFSYSTWANAYGLHSAVHLVLDALALRGWRFNQKGKHHKRAVTAPCEKCGKSFQIDDREHRICDDCLPPPPPPEQWQIDLQWARERLRQRDEKRARLAELEARYEALHTP
jgi:hypothetical protein